MVYLENVAALLHGKLRPLLTHVLEARLCTLTVFVERSLPDVGSKFTGAAQLVAWSGCRLIRHGFQCGQSSGLAPKDLSAGGSACRGALLQQGAACVAIIMNDCEHAGQEDDER